MSGNCTAQDNTVILPANAEVCDNDQETSVSRKYDFSQTMLETPDHDYCMYSPSDSHSTFTATIVTYIYIYSWICGKKKYLKQLNAKFVPDALYTTTPSDYDKRFILIKLRDNGGLTYRLMSNTGNLSPMDKSIRQVLRWIRWTYTLRNKCKYYNYVIYIIFGKLSNIYVNMLNAYFAESI